MSRKELREIWEQRVAEFRASGQSVASWCASQGIPPHQLHYWLRKFSDCRPMERTSSIRWLSVQVDESPVLDTEAVVLRVGSVMIEVKPGFDPLLLRQVVQVLTTSC